MMEVLMSSILAILLGGFALCVLVHAQDQSGFLSIDCGIAEDAGYTDTTGISYISDANFIDTGIAYSILPEFQTPNLSKQLLHVRSFPQGIKNCYTLTPPQGEENKYLIRAWFMYGNYDAKDQNPEFDLYLGVNMWDSVNLENASNITIKEIIHVLTSSSIFVCFVNTGRGTPFVSALELRLLNNSMYATKSGSLVNILRLDLGSTSNEVIRYKDDVYDRIWFAAINSPSWGKLSTPFTINNGNDYQPPSKVLQSAITPIRSNSSLNLYWKPDDLTSSFCLYMHFAEIQRHEANESRELNIYLNGDLFYGPLVLTYLVINTIYSRNPVTAMELNITINTTENSTLPPIISAVEIYMVKELLQPHTEDEEVHAVMNIKSMYGVKKNWQGDPCAPKTYMWNGLNCSYSGYNTLRIISLDLSSSGLTGLISPDISNLTMIQFLDLSNNSLSGSVPDFLSQLLSLRVLNLTGNNLTGSIPVEIIERSKKGLLLLSVDANLCKSQSCDNSSSSINNNDNGDGNGNKKKVIVPLVASVVALFLILGALTILWCLKRRNKAIMMMGMADVVSNQKDGLLEPKKQQFTYSEVLTITNNFERVIGRGGFGTVYHGYLANTQVAVKMLSPSSIQGYEQFRTEAELLMRVHHRNLTSLIGYCDEATNMLLIYEYMSNGNLRDHLSDRNVNVFSWEQRLQTAIDAGQGLEYLHSGSKPLIIHRDVNPTNILLNDEFHAKLADFGLSKVFQAEGDSHVSTRVIGTPGYLDPEYYVSNRLNEKSDVFSFGVVLLEIITGRTALGRDHKKTHIIQWIAPLLENGDVRNIADARLCKEFEISSVWRAIELAMACVSSTSPARPTMNYVVMELKECFALEKARVEGHGTGEVNSYEAIPLYLDSDVSPPAR
ncbi:putative leucine-rich repeat receptor-like protein kinase At2g19210 [Malania oleifera]|uniref:putative leucine-rich repeat receptor-like protein kinase At2g19210 n=1 Tax=Malania oleifera TaxID=397392 RepID=UPI0025ADF02C|nr:putative leucine-rich repeat receptor-like protein kinase At2g19210 [Malania oleifera]